MLKRVISDESGRTLAWTLIIMAIGVLLIPTFLSHASTNLFATRASEEGLKELYAADSGVEYVLLQLKNGITQGSHSYTINDRYVVVTWGEHITETYKITSTATSQIDGGSTAIESYIGEITMIRSVFNHAAAALGSDDKECDIDFGGNSDIDADVELGGDVYANGNVCTHGNAMSIDGDAAATGEIDDPHNTIEGVKEEGAPPLVAPDIDIPAYKAEAETVECGPINYPWGLTIDSPDDYAALQYPLHVEGDLDISAAGTFTGTVCVTGDLNIGSEVTFMGPVKVEGALDISSNEDVTFEDTGYVGGSGLKISSHTDIELGGTFYVCGEIQITGNAALNLLGGEAFLVEGDIFLSGTSDFNGDTEDIPLVISTNGNIKLTGNNETAAIVYAPNGNIDLQGNSSLYGAAVGLSVIGNGNNDIFYPSDLMDARDLPADVLGLEVRTYHIYP